MNKHRLERPTKDRYFMTIAILVATRATCIRRQVGCVLTNSIGHILSTGYNGVARGMEHCIDNPCDGSDSPSGEDLHLCKAIHAEQNALLQCRDVHEIDTVYCTTMPCVTCIKLLLNTSARRIVYFDEYTHSDAVDLWLNSGRELEQIESYEYYGEEENG